MSAETAQPTVEDRLRAKFPDDALQRLVRSNQEYYSTHGDYLPELASLLLIERAGLRLARQQLANTIAHTEKAWAVARTQATEIDEYTAHLRAARAALRGLLDAMLAPMAGSHRDRDAEHALDNAVDAARAVLDWRRGTDGDDTQARLAATEAALEAAHHLLDVDRAISGWPGCLEDEQCTQEKFVELLAERDVAEAAHEDAIAALESL